MSNIATFEALVVDALLRGNALTMRCDLLVERVYAIALNAAGRSACVIRSILQLPELFGSAISGIGREPCLSNGLGALP